MKSTENDTVEEEEPLKKAPAKRGRKPKDASKSVAKPEPPKVESTKKAPKRKAAIIAEVANNRYKSFTFILSVYKISWKQPYLEK